MKKFILLLGIGLISLIPLLWFKGDFIIAKGDDSLFLDPTAFFENIKWSWDTFFYNCGSANNSMPLLFPFSLFWMFLTKVGIGLSMIQRMWLVGVWLITGFSMFYLARVLGLEPIASFFAVVLYQLNTFVAQQPLIYNFRLPYMMLPLLSAFTIRGLSSKTNIIRYIILFSISTLLMAAAWTNPPWVMSTFILIFFYILYRFFSAGSREERGRITYFATGIGIFTFLLNLWWLVPNIASFGKSLVTIGGLNLNIFKGAGFYEVFRFLRSWAFNRSGYGYHDLYYGSWIIILATYLIPITVFSSLFRNKRGFKEYNFFVFLSLAAMFFAKGPLPPLGMIYEYMFRNFPGFVMFREPYTKFTPLVIFGFAILFGDSVNWIYGMLKNRYKRYISSLFSISMLLVVCAAVSPIFGRSIIWQSQTGWNRNRGERSAYVDVPSYWFTARKWIGKNFKKGHLFITPRPTGVYNWESGFNCGDTVARFLLDVPVISCSGNSSMAIQVLNAIYDVFIEENRNLCDMLGIFNVSYILHDKDLYTNTHWRFHDINYRPPWYMKKILKKQKGLEFSKSIGNLDFYKIEKEYYLPKIYTANNFSYIINTAYKLLFSLAGECLQGNPCFFTKEHSPLDTLPEKLRKQISNYVYLFDKIMWSNYFVADILESGNYDIFLKLTLNYIHQTKPSGDKIEIDLIDLITKSKFYCHGIPTFNYEVSPSEIVLTVPFDGPSEEDEYLQIKDFNPQGKDVDIDLDRYPYLSFCYRIEDPKVQTLQIVFGIDTDKDDMVDQWVKCVYENPTFTKYFTYLYNLRNIARSVKYTDYCHILKIEVYPHKLWEVDCSRNPKEYSFYIKRLQFYSKLSSKNKVVLKDKVWDRALSKEDIVIKQNEIIVDTDAVDLAKYNMIEFLWRNIDTSEECPIDVKLVLDIDNDGAADKEEVVYTFDGATEKVLHQIDFSEVMALGYEGISNVKLLSIHWDSPNVMAKDMVDGLERIIIYQQQPLEDYEDFHFKDYVFSIDGERYLTECSATVSYKTRNIVVQHKDIPLTSGEKHIENLLVENDPFRIEWICLKKSTPVTASQKEMPQISWEKLNPTKYSVHITGATAPFLLVFCEGFHQGWQAYFCPEYIKIDDHFPANGYAQAWWIDPPSADFEILIEYLPQDWTDIGWGISGIALLGCLIYLLWRRK